MNDVRDRVAFVTGGASGIGLGITKVLLGAGAKAVIADLRPDHLDEAQASARLRRQPAARAPARRHRPRRDGRRPPTRSSARSAGIDILVNNAGVGIEGPLARGELCRLGFRPRRSISAGVINGLQTFVPRIRAGGRGGHVVNTASLAGLVQMPSCMAIYATAKAAVIALTESIRDDLAADGIGASVLCPGPIKSRIHELSRNRPARFEASKGFSAAAERLGQREVSPLWMEPEEVGQMVLDAILANQLYVITHGEWRGAVQQRHDAILAAMPTQVNPELIASLRPKE